jgi:hypothetical protein
MQDNAIKVKVCGQDSPDLVSAAISSVEKKIADKEFNEHNIGYIRDLKLKLVEGGLNVSEKDLEKLRTLCKLWDVELKPSEISSHRPFVGPFIVAVKKLLFPVIRIFLKDSFKQQRDFNAAAVSMIADLMNKKTN